MDETRFAHFQNIVHHFRNAMLVTHDADGWPHARPMELAGHDPGGDLWFHCTRGSHKCEEIVADDRAAVTLQGDGRYLSLTGRAVIEDDRQRVAALWKEAWRAWYPRGPEDPELVLIHVKPDHGEYWDRHGLAGVRVVLRETTARVRRVRVGGTDDIDAHGEVHTF